MVGKAKNCGLSTSALITADIAAIMQYLGARRFSLTLKYGKNKMLPLAENFLLLSAH